MASISHLSVDSVSVAKRVERDFRERHPEVMDEMLEDLVPLIQRTPFIDYERLDDYLERVYAMFCEEAGRE